MVSELHRPGHGCRHSAASTASASEQNTGDPVSAHAVRLTRSAGRLVAMLNGRIEARLQGICFGAGIEVPAFAGTVRASPDVRIALPEVSLGLIPGAGGTVSLPRRIGRHRTALLALTGVEIDASTAHRWGLVDRVDDATADS